MKRTSKTEFHSDESRPIPFYPSSLSSPVVRRPLPLTVVAAALLFLLTSGTAAATPIPGTPIQILELDPTTKTISLGAQTNFSWAVFNGGPRYDLTVAANSSDSDFLLEVSPSTFTLGGGAITG